VATATKLGDSSPMDDNNNIEKNLGLIENYTKWIFVMVFIVFVGKVLSFIGNILMSAL